MKTQPNTTYPEQKNPDSDPVNILQGLRGNSYVQGRNISIVPDDNDTQEICDMMQSIWKDKGMPNILQFKFYATISEMERGLDNVADLALVFSDTKSASFNYTIMTDPSVSPGTFQKTVGLDTCRYKQGSGGSLEGPGTCPVNGYYYSGFLGLQYLVDQAFLQKVRSNFD